MDVWWIREEVSIYVMLSCCISVQMFLSFFKLPFPHVFLFLSFRVDRLHYIVLLWTVIPAFVSFSLIMVQRWMLKIRYVHETISTHCKNLHYANSWIVDLAHTNIKILVVVLDANNACTGYIGVKNHWSKNSNTNHAEKEVSKKYSKELICLIFRWAFSQHA